MKIAAATLLVLAAGPLAAGGTLSPEEAHHRESRLRAEAAAHQEMEREFAAARGGSRADRRWRRTVIRLCREYIASAVRAADAYDHVAKGAVPEADAELHAGAHAALPVTAAEYRERAAAYELEAESLRTDAAQHTAMLQPPPGDVFPPDGSDATAESQVRRGGFFQSSRDEGERRHWRRIAQQSLELARQAENMARHYRLRARQLEAQR